MTRERLRVAFVHSLCTHYTRRLFELLAERHEVDFLFTDGAGLSFWPEEHGQADGRFRGTYLAAIGPHPVRIQPALPFRLATGRYDLIVKDIGSRFALPVTFAASRALGIPFVLWTGVWCHFDTRFHRAALPLLRAIYHRSDAIVTYGGHVDRHLKDEGVEPARLFQAPHAVDNRPYARHVEPAALERLRARHGIAPDQRVVSFVGRLVPEKGVDLLVEALARSGVHDLALLIAGSGPERARLERLADAAGVRARVHFAGHVDSDACVEHYALAWAQVVPSMTTATFREPWGLVVNEAFNQGVPVIASDAVGAAAGGLVEHGRNGLKFPERDVDALAALLARLAREPGLRDALADGARATIGAWTQERMVEGFEAAFEHARGRRSRRA